METLIPAAELSVLELVRRVQRGVKRVHEDVVTLAEFGLIERTDKGGVVCPYADIHVDMHLGSPSWTVREGYTVRKLDNHLLRQLEEL